MFQIKKCSSVVCALVIIFTSAYSQTTSTEDRASKITTDASWRIYNYNVYQERVSENISRANTPESRVYKIRTGEDLTKTLKRIASQRVHFPNKSSYTTEVKGRAVVDHLTKQLMFIGLEEVNYWLFDAALRMAEFPYVDTSIIESDTLVFGFDFSSLLSRKELRSKEVIESYTPPMLNGQSTPNEWMQEVLGEQNCKLLYLRRVRSIGAIVDIDSSGSAFIDMIYSRVEIDKNSFSTPSAKWSPAIVNGQKRSMSHYIVFMVDELLSQESRVQIDEQVIVDSSGKLFDTRDVDQAPLFLGQRDWQGTFAQWVHVELFEGGLERTAEQNRASKQSYKPEDMRYLTNIQKYYGEYSRAYTKTDYKSKGLKPNYNTAESIDFDKYVDEVVKSDKKRSTPDEVVYASFIVNADGSIGDVKISRSTSQLFSALATKLILSSEGLWSPAIHEGKRVRTLLTARIDSREEKKSNSRKSTQSSI